MEEELKALNAKLDRVIALSKYEAWNGMLNVDHFCEKFDIPKKTVMTWIYDKKECFPAYKLGKHWYVDMKKFPNWRDNKHIRSYKYA
ncbi:MAG: helix-turn-helix domain-containing protein [Candidatus Ornithomonoglobus sp.]